MLVCFFFPVPMWETLF